MKDKLKKEFEDRFCQRDEGNGMLYVSDFSHIILSWIDKNFIPIPAMPKIAEKVLSYPKELFYNFSKECQLPHGVGYKKDVGYNILFSMNYNTDWHKAIAEEIVRCWNKEHENE